MDKPPIEIDFTPPFRCIRQFLHNFIEYLEVGVYIGNSLFFRRIDMIEELQTTANLSIPKDLSSEEANMYLMDACVKYGVQCPPPQTTARLLDKVNTFLIL